MSDTMTLSHHYATCASFVEHFNRSVGAVKRRHKRAGLPADAADVREARDHLIAVLRAVVNRLGSGPGQQAVQVVAVPEEVFERLTAGRRNDLAWFLQDLEAALSALETERPLDERAWAVLDEIGDAADAVASASFRRLWRR